MNFNGIFQRAAQTATLPTDYGQRLPVGIHTVVLERYETKSAPKNKNQTIVEADFTVAESSDPSAIGSTRRWSWFLDSDEYGYANGRALTFAGVIGQCVGDATPAPVLADQLNTPGQPGRGITLKVVIKPVLLKDGSPRKSAKGEPVTNMDAIAVPNTPEQIQAMRARLDSEKPSTYGQQQTQTAQAGPWAQAPAAQAFPVQFQQAPPEQAPAWGQQAPVTTPAGAWGQQAPAPQVQPATQQPSPQVQPATQQPAGGFLLGNVQRR